MDKEADVHDTKLIPTTRSISLESSTQFTGIGDETNDIKSDSSSHDQSKIGSHNDVINTIDTKPLEAKSNNQLNFIDLLIETPLIEPEIRNDGIVHETMETNEDFDQDELEQMANWQKIHEIKSHPFDQIDEQT